MSLPGYFLKHVFSRGAKQELNTVRNEYELVPIKVYDRFEMCNATLVDSFL